MTVKLIILDQEAILDFQFGPDLKNETFLDHCILDLDNLLFRIFFVSRTFRIYCTHSCMSSLLTIKLFQRKTSIRPHSLQNPIKRGEG